MRREGSPQWRRINGGWQRYLFRPLQLLLIVPSKNIAAILNNESNLRILDKLKQRPFYPRELSAEMGLSEPFIVRRLKAMEEYDIVEGRWETEKNGRKVKRYYVKDITMQLGKDGLKVTSEYKPVRKEIETGKEIVKFLIYLPVIVFIAIGFFFAQPVIMGISLFVFLWQTFVNIAFYRNYRYKTLLTSIFLLVVGIASMSIFTWVFIIHNRLPTESSTVIGLVYFAVGLAFFMGLIYHIRYSQIEGGDMLSDKKELIENLNSASVPVKVFYLPLVIRCKLNEYFNLV